MDKEQINRDFIRTARAYKISPLFLKEISYQRIKGRNNLSIAKITGLSRNTVNKYVRVLNSMNQIEIKIVLMRLLID